MVAMVRPRVRRVRLQVQADSQVSVAPGPFKRWYSLSLRISEVGRARLDLESATRITNQFRALNLDRQRRRSGRNAHGRTRDGRIGRTFADLRGQAHPAR